MALYTHIINRHSFNWIWLIKWHHKMFDLSQTIDSRESYIPRDGSTNGYLSGNTLEMAGGDINLLLKSIKINNDDMYKQYVTCK